jgi:hypothetical protein
LNPIDDFELTQPCEPPPDTATMSDADVINESAQCMRTENAQRARRYQLFAELYARCKRERPKELADAIQPHFVPTALQATAAEFAPLLALAESTVHMQLDTYTKLTEWFPVFWALCLSGRLDIGKASILADAAEDLEDPADIDAFAELMNEFLRKMDNPDAPIVPITRRQILNAARYRKLKFRQKSKEQNFHEAFSKRKVSLRLNDNGMGYLGVNHAAHELTCADYRLTLIAKKIGETDGKGRTLDQLRADAMLDLLMGRLTVDARNSELEDDATDAGEDPAETFHHGPTGAFARPVINVTVPIQSLIGASDDPGVMSGDQVLPADLVRHIASDPTSTWYRLLTDEADSFAHLSTNRYQPTAAIWRTVVAKQRTCIWPGCCRPATRCQLDHRTEWPEGETCPDNLEPLCERHHRLKHADGFTVTADDDGGYTVTTRRGSTFRTHPSEQPVGDWPQDPATESHPAA